MKIPSSLIEMTLAALLGFTVSSCTGDISLAWEYRGSEPIWSTPLPLDTGGGKGLVLMGDEAGYLNALDMETGAHKWRFPTRQDVYSSPVADKEKKRIMFGSTNYFFYCLDREGNLLWKFPTGSRIKSDPAVWDGKVYFGSYDKEFYALSITDGSLVWTFPPKHSQNKGQSLLLGENKKEENGKNPGREKNEKEGNSREQSAKEPAAPRVDYRTGAFSYSSPAIFDATVFVGNMDHHVYALDARTGALKWRFETNGEVTSSPVVANGVVYIGSHDKNLYALDAKTGKLAWKFTTGGKVMSAIRVYEGKVFFGSFDSNFYALDAKTGKLAWKFTTKGPLLSGAAFHDGRVFFGGGRGDHNFYGLDAKTGKQIWTFKNRGGRMDADAVVHKDMLYMACGDRGLYAFKLKPYRKK